MEKIDVAIIGGGVIGLAVAAGIARSDKDIFIFERNKTFGQEISSRNSEVIHSGIYYPKDSLKARTCIEGSSLLYRICRENNIPHKKTGKLIVARDASEVPHLEILFNNGRENGLEDIKMISAKEAKKIEPNVSAVQAIYLPGTGIVDSHSLMEHFLGKARDNGADIVYDSEVTQIEKTGKTYIVTVSGGKGEIYTFEARVVINAAGLDSDSVAKMVGMEKVEYTLSYCKGDYFRVGQGKNSLVKGLVYPVVKPDDSSLGIHATPDLAGGMRLGPDAEYLDSREQDYDVDPGKRDQFYASVKGFLPFIEREDLSVDTSGIRPKLQGPGEGFRDFVIRHETEDGFTGFIDLIGIESPGLTASIAIARMVKKMVDGLV